MGGRARRGIDSHLGQSNQLIEPAIGDHHIVIEQHQVFPARLLQPLIDGGRETSVLSHWQSP